MSQTNNKKYLIQTQFNGILQILRPMSQFFREIHVRQKLQYIYRLLYLSTIKPVFNVIRQCFKQSKPSNNCPIFTSTTLLFTIWFSRCFTHTSVSDLSFFPFLVKTITFDTMKGILIGPQVKQNYYLAVTLKVMEAVFWFWNKTDCRPSNKYCSLHVVKS